MVKRKLLIALFVFVSFFGLSLKLAHAQAPMSNIPEYALQQQAMEAGIVNGAVNMETQGYYTNVLTSQGPTLDMLVGGLPKTIPGQLDASGKPKIYYSKGLVGDMGKAIAMIYQNQPANTQTYVADILNSAGIVQPAYAQGLGFASLTPILNTWKIFRNIAYFFFVILFLIIGFMIMLRQKIGGQTVVTAQQAIPHIIISLLFVTFSYAIAGFLIDLMYLSMFFMLSIFNKSGAADQFIGMNFVQLGFKMASTGFTTALEGVSTFTEAAQSSLGQVAQETASFLGGLTMAIIIAIAISLNVFRLFFELLKTYVTIVLNIVFAPILLMLGAIPGKNVFGAWVKNIVGNLAAFPAVLLVLIVFDELTSGLTGNGSASAIEEGGFLPPYLFGRNGTGAAGALSFAVGLGMLMIMPEIVKQVKKAFGVKEGIFEQLANDIGQSVKKGWNGGDLVPGLGWTNTNKLPVVGPWLGSGKSAVQKGAIVGSHLAGRAAGLPVGAFQAATGLGPFARAGRLYGNALGRRVADAADDKQMYTRGREQRKKGTQGYMEEPT